MTVATDSPFTAEELEPTLRPLLEASLLPAARLHRRRRGRVGSPQPVPRRLDVRRPRERARRARRVPHRSSWPARACCSSATARATRAGSSTSAATAASRLLTEPEGTTRRLQCPYHAWSYGFDGTLQERAPHRRAAGLRPRLQRPAARSAPRSPAGWCSPTSPASRRRWPTTSARSSSTSTRYRTGELRRGARIDYDVAANWKAIVENYSECLHCPGVHPELNRLSHYLSGDDYRGPGRLVRRLDDAHQGGRRHDGAQRRPRRPAADRRRRPARRPVLRDLPELPGLAAPGLRDAAHAVAGRRRAARRSCASGSSSPRRWSARASTAPTRSSSGTWSTARTGRSASWRSSASARAGYTPGRYTEVEGTVHDFDRMVAEAYLR